MNLTSWNETISAITREGTPYTADYIFYMYMVSQCRIKFDPELPAPAAVNFEYDHFNLFINLDQWSTLLLDHRVGILKHEMLHLLYQHIFRKEDRIHENFNFAADCAENQQIKREHLPTGAVLPDTLAKLLTKQSGKTVKVPPNLSAEDYYDLIMKVVNENPDKFPSRAMAGNGDSDVDDHGKWEEGKGDPNIAKNMAKAMLDKAADQTQKSRGNLPSEYAQLVELLGATPKVRWQQVLKKVAGNKRVDAVRTFYKPNRRLPDMMHVKGTVKDRKYDLLVVADVSGSVSNEELLYGLNEIQHISRLTGTATKLVQVDTDAYPPENIGSKVRSFKRKAAGGTNLHPALEMANNHGINYNAIVVITDGYLCTSDINVFANTGKKVIWLLTEMVEQGSFNQGKMQSFQLKD
jgi:predicted metal-dependent peptidase